MLVVFHQKTNIKIIPRSVMHIAVLIGQFSHIYIGDFYNADTILIKWLKWFYIEQNGRRRIKTLVDIYILIKS